MNQKQTFITCITVSLCLGFAASFALQKLNWFESKKVNIFEKTRLEAKGIKWKNRIDSSHRVEPLRIAGELFFAGERVPLEDPEVWERLDRELQVNVFWHSNTLLSMKLANRYFPVIEKILEEESVPNDFKYLPLIESGFRDVVSPSGAVGFWQFLAPTAKLYDLEVRSDIDERYHIEKSTRAACAYLKKAKEKFGNWTLAAASYNLGMQAMSERCKTQNTYNYYELLLNQETSRYVFRMLAMKIIFSHPEAAGYYLKTEDLYQPYQYKTVLVDTPISNITHFASQFGLQYRHIKLLNPWLRDNHLHNKEKKVYEIKILQ
jgi:hypothetical protein